MTKHPVNFKGTIHRVDNDRIVVKHRHTHVHVFFTPDIPQSLREDYAARVGGCCSIWAKKNTADQFELCKPRRSIPVSIPYEERGRVCENFPNGAVRKTGALGWTVIGIRKDFTMWQSGRFRALSSLVNIDDGHQPPHYEWVVSFSQENRETVSNKDIARCLRDFDALDFEEDNHEPGIARKFFMPVERQYRKPCPCKDERMIALGEYRYSTTDKEPTS